MKKLLFVLVFMSSPVLADEPVHQYGDWLVTQSDQLNTALTSSTNHDSRFIVLQCGVDHKNCVLAFTDPYGCNEGAVNEVALTVDKHYFGISTTCTGNGWKADASQLYNGEVFGALKEAKSSLTANFGYGIISNYSINGLSTALNIIDGQQSNFSF
ncbi:hypothetical protein D5018_16830 [Parashewanella curva]|uniref:Uncharacterized protein n=1 Tax=Parashewanella curva TaxID=2338552 RepID=A0A3L8PSW5_9GAMM|nr:hypothetical protein [Parashewanella curva]RLV58517.1 hypothetical protein D5018_16830 [Parashewanella curva]